MFGNRSFGGVVATINRTWANKQLLACTRLRIVRWIIRTVQSVLPQPDLPPNSKGDLSVIFVSVNGHRSSFLLPLPIKNQSWTPTLRSTRGLVYDAVNRLAVEYNHCSQPTSVLLCSVVSVVVTEGRMSVLRKQVAVLEQEGAQTEDKHHIQSPNRTVNWCHATLRPAYNYPSI